MIKGNLRKMRTELKEKIQYSHIVNKDETTINEWIGKTVHLKHTGNIFCESCGKKTKKSFGQGSCYPCFADAPENSPCIIKPELCEGHLGLGRDPEWELKYHVQPHIVYLALTDKVKVGVTRDTQVPTRWIDQGAWKVVVFAETENRRQAGDIEVALKSHVTDKTSWQRMLKGEKNEEIDLLEYKNNLKQFMPEKLQRLFAEGDSITTLNFPIETNPLKVKSINLTKTPEFELKLEGIKGQYLIFEGGMVMNVRTYTSFEVEIDVY